MPYDYPLQRKPNIVTFGEDGEVNGGIIYDIWNGTMEQRETLAYDWDNSIFTIYMRSELSQSDKSKLDIIIQNNI